MDWLKHGKINASWVLSFENAYETGVLTPSTSAYFNNLILVVIFELFEEDVNKYASTFVLLVVFTGPVTEEIGGVVLRESTKFKVLEGDAHWNPVMVRVNFKELAWAVNCTPALFNVWVALNNA